MIRNLKIISIDDFVKLIKLLTDLSKKSNVLIHCAGGVGRTGFVGAGYMLENYLDDIKTYKFPSYFNEKACHKALNEEMKKLETTEYADYKDIKCQPKDTN